MKDEGRAGRFFVLEGTNASGKATQFELLADRLADEGYDVVTFDFPQYAQESSFFVREYLSGKYGTAQEVGPYTGSLFYALDRYSVRKEIEEALADGKIVLANRFTGSNMAHQATYFGKPEERRGFYLWLDDLEHRMLKVPRPTRNFILRVDSGTALHLLKKRAKETGKELDMHEKDRAHLKQAVTVYDELGILFPKDFTRIDCVRGGDLLEPAHIHELLWQTMQEDLPEPPGKKGSVQPGTTVHEHPGKVNQPEKTLKMVSLLDAVRLRLPIQHDTEGTLLQSLRPEQRDRNGNYAYYIPEGLSDKAKSAYTSAMNQLFGAYTKLYDQLKKTLSESDARAALQGIIPVSILVPVSTEQPFTTPKPNLVFNQLAETMLPSMHAKVDDPVKLVAYEPRNEFDLIPYMLYEQSNLSLTDIRSAVENWTYDEKEKVFKAYLAGEQTAQLLRKTVYVWDLLCDFVTLTELSSTHFASTICIQEPTARYGYSTPQSIVKSNTTELYERCFALTLETINSSLDKHFIIPTSYLLLTGHKLRAVIHRTGPIVDIEQPAPSEPTNKIIKILRLTSAEKHPLLHSSD